MVEQLISLGFIIILIGIILIVVGSILTGSKEKTKSGFAFGGFIGPFVFGFANREDLLKLVIALSLIMLVVFLLMNKKF